MKKLFVTVLMTMILATTAAAQDVSNVHQHSEAPQNARFEIVQSEIAAKWTFRLDRFTGHVAQLVGTENDRAWKEMEVEELETLPPALGRALGQTAPTRPRFQIFTSGLAAMHTFLIDTDTG